MAAASLVVEAALLEESELHADQALGPGVAALPKARLDRVCSRPARGAAASRGFEPRRAP